MGQYVVLLVQIFLFHRTLAQKGLQCFVPGECLDSQILDATPVDNSKECWRHCQNVTGCTWFTFYKDSQICTPLSGCLRLSNEKCQDNCISGEEECPEVQCGLNGRCYGALEGIRKVGSAKECGSICETHQECFWNTYDPDHESCLMTNDCPLLDRSCNNCSTSERNCVDQDDQSERELFFLVANSEMETYILSMNGSIFINMELTYIPLQPSPDAVMQFTYVDGLLGVCGYSAPGGKGFLNCYSLNRETAKWVSGGIIHYTNNQFQYFFNLPDGKIVALANSQQAFIFDGHEIAALNWNDFYVADSGVTIPYCRTAISNDEILLGFGPLSVNIDDLTIHDQLYSYRISTNVMTKINVTFPNFKLVSSLCGAFGPKTNRKVAIFGGYKYAKGQSNQLFEETLILDWNTKELDVNGPSLKEVNLHKGKGQTMGYHDTFMYYKYNKTETNIYRFDIKGTETKIPFVGKMIGEFENLALVPFEAILRPMPHSRPKIE